MSCPRYRSAALPHESTKYQAVYVVPVPPTRKDIWKILRGKYEPLLEERRAITSAGADKIAKEVYVDKVRDQLHQDNVLNFDKFRK